MPRAAPPRPVGREIAAGVAVSVLVVLAACATVFLLDLHPAVMIFGMILGSSLGWVRAQILVSRRCSAARPSEER